MSIMVESIKKLREICKRPEKLYEADSLYIKLLRNISIYFTKFFLTLNVKANQVTMLMIITGLIGVFFLALHKLLFILIGTLIINFSFLLDCVDGEIARYRKEHDMVGSHLDQIYHHLMPRFMYFGIALSVFFATNKIIVIIFGFLAAIFSTSIIFNTLAWELVRVALVEKKHNVKLGKKDKKSANKIEMGEIVGKARPLNDFLRKFKAVWSSPYDQLILLFLVILEIVNYKMGLIQPYSILYWYIIFYGILFSLIQIISFVVNIKSKTIEVYKKNLFGK